MAEEEHDGWCVPDYVAGAIEHAEPGSMVTKYLLIAEVLDPQGRRGMWVLPSDEQTDWDQVGMLNFAIARAHRNIARLLEENDN